MESDIRLGPKDSGKMLLILSKCSYAEREVIITRIGLVCRETFFRNVEIRLSPNFLPICRRLETMIGLPYENFIKDLYQGNYNGGTHCSMKINILSDFSSNQDIL